MFTLISFVALEIYISLHIGYLYSQTYGNILFILALSLNTPVAATSRSQLGLWSDSGVDAACRSVVYVHDKGREIVR